MTLRRRNIFLLVTCLSGAGLSLSARAAVPANEIPRVAAATNFLPPPPMPKLHSPVDTFRELLGMNLAERRQFLTNRPVDVQKQILTKLREYQSLKPDEQELRLRATELEWYLLPLMGTPRASREPRLALVPKEQRILVEERLDRWDRLPAAMREDMLNNEMTARYFAQLNETNREAVLGRISPERRAKLEAGLDRWRDMSEEQRDRTLDGFKEFFELTPAEKQQALSTLSETEQKQMEKTLQAYGKLSAEQRQKCILSFQKFAGMNLAERQEFLKNAERWKLMSPSDRAAWRKLVTFAPLQPAMPVRHAPPPPMPSPLIHTVGAAVATNSN